MVSTCTELGPWISTLAHDATAYINLNKRCDSREADLTEVLLVVFRASS